MQGTQTASLNTSKSPLYVSLIVASDIGGVVVGNLHSSVSYLFLGEIAISPTYFVSVIISSVSWPNTIFLLATFAISPKYIVTFLKVSKTFWNLFYITIFSQLSFFHKFLFLFYITKIVLLFRQKVWPSDHYITNFLPISPKSCGQKTNCENLQRTTTNKLR